MKPHFSSIRMFHRKLNFLYSFPFWFTYSVGSPQFADIDLHESEVLGAETFGLVLLLSLDTEGLWACHHP